MRTAEDEAFELEFSKLMQETSRQVAKPAAASIDRMAVPLHVLANPKEDEVQLQPSAGAGAGAWGTGAAPAPMVFRLLTRGAKGKVETAGAIHVPTDAKMARAVQRDLEEKLEGDPPAQAAARRV